MLCLTSTLQNLSILISSLKNAYSSQEYRFHRSDCVTNSVICFKSHTNQPELPAHTVSKIVVGNVYFHLEIEIRDLCSSTTEQFRMIRSSNFAI